MPSKNHLEMTKGALLMGLVLYVAGLLIKNGLL